MNPAAAGVGKPPGIGDNAPQEAPGAVAGPGAAQRQCRGALMTDHTGRVDAASMTDANGRVDAASMTDARGGVDAASIVRDGRHGVLADYALRESLLGKLHSAFLDGVERLAGTASRRAVEQDGLGCLHRHFPVEKVDLLEDFILKRVRDDLYYWTYAVGARDLGLAHPFYVDYLIVLRIHYPYLAAKQGGRPEPVPYPVRERLRLALASLRDPRLIAHEVGKRLRRRRMMRDRRLAYDPRSYHGNLPVRARAHGAHIDTWYGHSYDGINLWLSIAGVNDDNTVILYPGMFGRRVDYDPKSMYLAAGIPLPRPEKVRLAPGELLVFNPEMLHGTQVNISTETRLALTTRLNPHTPRFNDDAPFNLEHWYASEDLARRRFGTVRVFPADRHRGTPSRTLDDAPVMPPTPEIVLPEVAPEGDTVLCAVDALPAGGKLAITAPEFRLLLVRTRDGVRAYDRRCPHRGIDLKDGFSDDDEIFCPGHGVAFRLADGTSRCAAFTLRSFEVAEREGRIVLVRPVPALTSAQGDTVPG